jgi:exodeoxyribonuclease VII large subunit
MPENINDRNVFSLLEVTMSIQKTLSARYASSFWVKAEMIKVNRYKYSGHAYPELVEKKEGKIVAQMRSILWSSQFENINSEFLRVTREPLKDGINIMFRAQINFSPEHGLSLRILDIDPSYTLGDLEKEKQETIRKLKEDGDYDKNKKLELPILPQRIAIISVETSKGYADFIDVLSNNEWGYKFFHMLFPSLLQGDEAAVSIRAQLNRIRKVQHHFDLVAIIRGGGGDVGLSCYNNYEMSKEIAQFPIPVITGIGHSTNETVAEMISHTNKITPTKLAEFLIQKFHNFSIPVNEGQRIVVETAERMLHEHALSLTEITKYFQSISQASLLREGSELESLKHMLVRQSETRLAKSKESLTVESNKLLSAAKDRMLEEKKSFQLALNEMDKSTRTLTQKARISLSEMSSSLKISPANILKENNERVNNAFGLLHKSFMMMIQQQKRTVEEQEKQVQLLDPVKVLERGYSITYLDGKALHHSMDVNQGDIIETKLLNGKLESVVRTTNLVKWKKRNRTQKPSKNFKK